jgi:hypothetical protein
LQAYKIGTGESQLLKQLKGVLFAIVVCGSQTKFVNEFQFLGKQVLWLN